MLKIGWSKRDVSTTEPIMIPGQMHARVSKGIMDPIMLNCLVVGDDKDIAIFLSGDFLCGRSIIDSIRKKVKSRRADIPAEKIVFNVTHTHCSADLGNTSNDAWYKVSHDGVEVYPTEKYQEFMTDMAFEAISEAFDNRAEGYIAYGYGYAVVSHSRRSTYSDDQSLREGNESNANSSLAVDGHARMYGPTNDDQFIGYEGGADHYANFMYTFDKNKKLTGAIINIPCPSQNSEIESYLSADYWHNVREILYSKYGEIGVVTQCAAAGDSAPRTLHYKGAEARRYELKYGEQANRAKAVCDRRDIAERICNAFDEVLSWAKNDLIDNAEVGHTVKTIQLEELLITDDQYKLAKEQVELLRAENLTLPGNPQEDFEARTLHAMKINRFDKVIDRYEKQQNVSKFTNMELHAIKIGDIAFATNGFELYTDFQHQIQARSPFVQTFIVQLTDQPAGNLIGYLATERGLNNLGYSANIYSNNVSAKGGHTLVEETLKELNNLHN